MKLYGLALAAIPRENYSNIIDMTCTPISVADKKQTEFEVLDKLAFKTTFNVTKGKEVRNCFVKTADLIEKLVDLQKASLAENHVKDYRPVVLQIGQDSRKPIRRKKLIRLLFGGASSPHAFKNANEKLYQLLDQCTLKWGSFNIVDAPQPDAPQTDLDVTLNKLKEPFLRGDQIARAQIIGLARQEGIKAGNEVNQFPAAFGHIAPAKYFENLSMQEKYPSYGFYNWDPAFRKAFFVGYNDTVRVPHNRLFKLPTNARNPPFSDTCANMIRDQFEIIYGERAPERVEDMPKWRKIIADAAWNNTRKFSRE